MSPPSAPSPRVDLPSAHAGPEVASHAIEIPSPAGGGDGGQPPLDLEFSPGGLPGAIGTPTKAARGAGEGGDGAF